MQAAEQPAERAIAAKCAEGASTRGRDGPVGARASRRLSGLLPVLVAPVPESCSSRALGLCRDRRSGTSGARPRRCGSAGLQSRGHPRRQHSVGSNRAPLNPVLTGSRPSRHNHETGRAECRPRRRSATHPSSAGPYSNDTRQSPARPAASISSAPGQSAVFLRIRIVSNPFLRNSSSSNGTRR